MIGDDKQEVERQQWVQPLFMLYDAHSDEFRPLTQQDLDTLVFRSRVLAEIQQMNKKYQSIIENQRIIK